MTLLDWIIVGGFFLFLGWMVLISRKQTKSVADFLAANRCAGRYLLTVSDGIASLGAVSILGAWQIYSEAGFTAVWWSNINRPVMVIIALTGFVVYRYRRTRALTLAQFFEVRYDKKIRVIGGMLQFLSGVFCFSIYPSVAARFLIYFGGLPVAIPTVFGSVSTFPVVLVGVMSVAIFFTLTGGQIAIIFSDFLQGLLVITVFTVIGVMVYLYIDWSAFERIVLEAPKGHSLINPFDSQKHADFNMWYYVIGAFGAFYAQLAFSGNQGYNASAKSSHEARMAKILATWRGLVQAAALLLVPLAVYYVMRDSATTTLAGHINSELDTIANPAIRSQMAVPISLRYLLPVGLRGLVCAVVLAAFISTQDSGLHAWGSIFLQDIVMPFRKKPFDPKRHILYLRLSILAIAVVSIIISLTFRQTQALFIFFALASSICISGAGACIIGGLYWKKGATAGAMGSLITGAVISIGGFVLEQVWTSVYGHSFPIGGQYMFAIAMGASITVYVVLSLLQNQTFNLDKMLHRGPYARESEDQPGVPSTALKSVTAKRWYHHALIKLGLSGEFTKSDTVVFIATIGWTLFWFLQFLLICLYRLFFGISDHAWFIYWRVFMSINLILGVFVALWFGIGGIMNSLEMFKRLKTATRDDRDDGTVINHHNLDDE